MPQIQQSPIHAHQDFVHKILSDEYRFKVPNYQRPYSWTTDQVVYPDNGVDPQTLLSLADQALYEGKRQGGDCICGYESSPA